MIHFIVANKYIYIYLFKHVLKKDPTFNGKECAENNMMTSSFSLSENFFISSKIREPIAFINNGCVAHRSITLIFKSSENRLKNKFYTAIFRIKIKNKIVLFTYFGNMSI